MPTDSFGARGRLHVGPSVVRDRPARRARHDRRRGRLPFSLKVLLENLLRHEDGTTVSQTDVEALARWTPASAGTREIAFAPARVLMQDFTGVPAIVDLAAMRDAHGSLRSGPGQDRPRRYPSS